MSGFKNNLYVADPFLLLVKIVTWTTATPWLPDQAETTESTHSKRDFFQLIEMVVQAFVRDFYGPGNMIHPWIAGLQS